ncbi:MAG TPA: GNAT family N-acetyltransferase [Ureibacillus sp.]|nr:GNAT family N-acetyltransferase [Ureibacillus sp.]
MQVKLYESQYAERVATLLNEHLPFQEENALTVDEAGGVRYVYVDGEEVIGYIAGFKPQNLKEEMPYFEDELYEIHRVAAQKLTFYTSHLVVHPDYRGAGIGRSLVAAYMEKVSLIAEVLITVGWVKSDTGKWDAEKLFASFGLEPLCYVPQYFKPYEVYCPSCKALCYCDSHIFWKHFA